MTVRVAAAASLRVVVEEIAQEFESAHPGVEVRVSVASSGTLRHQIEQGQAADVHISAHVRHMESLLDGGLVDAGTHGVFATNSLVVAAPAGSATALDSLEDLTHPAFRRIAIGDPRTAPVGEYAEAALQAAGLWETLEPRLIFAGNAIQLSTHLRNGEVDAAIVYATDLAALAGQATALLPVDTDLHPPIVCPIAVVQGAHSRALAEAFVAFAMSPGSREILRRHGFGTPD